MSPKRRPARCRELSLPLDSKPMSVPDAFDGTPLEPRRRDGGLSAAEQQQLNANLAWACARWPALLDRLDAASLHPAEYPEDGILVELLRQRKSHCRLADPET